MLPDKAFFTLLTFEANKAKLKVNGRKENALFLYHIYIYIYIYIYQKYFLLLRKSYSKHQGWKFTKEDTGFLGAWRHTTQWGQAGGMRVDCQFPLRPQPCSLLPPQPREEHKGYQQRVSQIQRKANVARQTWVLDRRKLKFAQRLVYLFKGSGVCEW
jgi:hypothetical protein